MLRSRSLRAKGLKPTPVMRQVTSGLTSVTAPVGGWDLTSPVSAMRADRALVLDNLFPSPQEVSLRKGFSSHATGLGATVYSLIHYASGSATKRFAATNAGIYDITAGGAVGAAAISLTDGKLITLNYSNTSGSYLFCVNGVDTLKLFDGTTWTSITGVSVPAITGITTSDISYVHSFKKRVWFIEKNSMSAWYLGTSAISGAATEFPLGEIFTKGGKLLSMASWTLDAGEGADDYLAFATSQGEIAIYKGTDPSSASAWFLVGVYSVGVPISSRCFLKFGGDLLYLSKDGLMGLSSGLQSTSIDRSKSISYLIQPAFTEAAQLYGANFGWQIENYSAANFLFVNVPVSTGQSHQYVMNTINKSWCRFTNMDATCWLVSESSLYFAEGAVVYQAWNGTSDNGSAVDGLCVSAFHKFGMPGAKHIELVQPVFEISASVSAYFALDKDFVTSLDTSLVTLGASSSSVWDTATWDSAVWSTGLDLTTFWLTIPNHVGYSHSLRLRISSSTSTFAWSTTNFIVKPAGLFSV